MIPTILLFDYNVFSSQMGYSHMLRIWKESNIQRTQAILHCRNSTMIVSLKDGASFLLFHTIFTFTAFGSINLITVG